MPTIETFRATGAEVVMKRVVNNNNCADVDDLQTEGQRRWC